MAERSTIYDWIKLPPGNLAITSIRVEQWGSRITLDCIYRYPPTEKTFRLIFSNCRGIEWTIQRAGAEIAQFSEAQLMTHDLGMEGHQRTARLATTLIELIISYQTLSVETDW